MSGADDAKPDEALEQRIARFFSGDRLDWRTPDGEAVMAYTLDYIERRVGWAYGLRLSAADRAELAEEVVMRVMKHNRADNCIQARDSVGYRSYLIRVITSAFIDAGRKTQRRVKTVSLTAAGEQDDEERHLDPEDAGEAGPEERVAWEELQERILRCVEDARVDYRRLLELDQQTQQWTTAELIALFGVTRTGLYKLRQMARMAFKRCYELITGNPMNLMKMRPAGRS